MVAEPSENRFDCRLQIAGSGNVPPRVAVLQDGSRLHYAVPLALQMAGMLERVFCDWYASPRSMESRIAAAVRCVKPTLGRKMSQRWCPGLDTSKVVRNPLFALCNGFGRRKCTTKGFIEESLRVGRWAVRQGWGDANALFGFIHNICPRLCRRARESGLLVVGDQMIAPLSVEIAELQKQMRRWKDWCTSVDLGDRRLMEAFEQETWRELDHVTCASAYVRDALVGQGMAPERVSVIPYPLAVDSFNPPDRSDRRGPLTVGFVGSVGLRKGSPYFLEVARKFAPRQMKFVMVGPVHAGSVRDFEPAEIVGNVPSSEVRRRLDRFDIFLFPSTCEGSALAVVEAMAAGLPVITSPNSGTPVRDGIEGFVRSYDDVTGMAECLQHLADDKDLRVRMGTAARRRAEEFSPRQYSRCLGELFKGLFNSADEPARSIGAACSLPLRLVS